MKTNAVENVLKRAQEIVEMSHELPPDSFEMRAAIARLEIALVATGKIKTPLVQVDLKRTFGETA